MVTAEQIKSLFDRVDALRNYLDIETKIVQLQEEELKTQAVNKAKQDAHSNLSKTDWYIIRMTDTGEEVPQTIINERAAIRLACDDKVAAINDATTIEQLKDL